MRVTQALEFVGAGRFEREAGPGKQKLRRGRDEHLAWHRNARDACGFMDGEAPYVVAYELDFARVNPGPDRNAQIGDRLTHCLGASNRSGGTVEGSEKAIAGRLDLAPSKPVQLEPCPLVVLQEQLTPRGIAKPPEMRG